MATLPLRKFMILIAVCFAWIATVDMQTSYACSYGGSYQSTLAGMISNFDYVVKAHIIEQDDANQNAILRVERYLAGGVGPEYILLNRMEPILVEYIRNSRSSGGDCLGFLGGINNLNSFYAFVSRDEDGSYHARIHQFNTPHSTIEVYIEGGVEIQGKYHENLAEYDSGIEVIEHEFVELIAKESGENPANPDYSYRYPLKSPLLIQTQTNNYIFPVDWQPPVSIESIDFLLSDESRYYVGVSGVSKCFTDDCNRISPDGLNVASIQEDRTITFSWEHTIEGQELLFASTSDAVAVWHDCNINIYTTGYPRLNQEWYQLEQVNSLTLDAETCETHHAQATWSPDGRQFSL